MTVGGFYAHFPSKQALIVEGLRRSLAETRCLLFENEAGLSPLERRRRAVRRYLCPEHRDTPERGCAFPSTLAEVSRSAAIVRRAIAKEIEAFAELFVREAGVSRPQALATIALLVGGIVMARAVRGTDLSDEILEACRALAEGDAR